MRVHVQTCLNRNTGLQDRRAHQPAPQYGGPIVWLRCELFLSQQSVVARHQLVVHDDLHVLLGEPSKLIEIAECIKKGPRPWIAAACGVGRLGQPERLAGFELIAKLSVKRECLVCPS